MDNWAVITKDDTLQQNSQKTYLVEFNFDKSWDGYAKTVIFEAGPANVVVVLKECFEKEDRCPVPKECLKYSGKLKIGIYGVKSGDRKAVDGYLSSMIIPDIGLNLGSFSLGGSPSDDVYSEIMAAIGDLSAAGFEGKTLAEVFREIKDKVCDTATDEEVGDALNDAFADHVSPDAPEEHFSNTATDKEVGDILDDVFGRLP